MTNNPGTWWQGIAALCRWGLAWLSIGLFTLLAGLNGMAALKTLVLRLRGGQEKKANAV